MLCSQCETVARAVCQFCGAAVCRAHARFQRRVMGWRTMGQRGWGAVPRTEQDFTVVPAATWCGSCVVEYYGNSA